MTNGDDDEREQPVAPSSSPSSSQSEVTRFLGLLISAVMAEARVWLAAAAATEVGTNGLPGFRRPPLPGGDVGAFARRQRRYEDLVLASFFGLQGVPWATALNSGLKSNSKVSYVCRNSRTLAFWTRC